MPERREHRRSKMVLPIKVFLPGAPQVLAHTIDISISGARIGGLREQLQPGKSVSLERGSQRAKFRDRKSTRLNSSHRCISYAVFCLKKKKNSGRAYLIELVSAAGTGYQAGTLSV